MLQPGGELDLALEAFRAERVSQVRMQDLERNRPVVTQILGEKDSGHAASPQLALESIRLAERRLESGEELWGRIAHTAAPCVLPVGRISGRDFVQDTPATGTGQSQNVRCPRAGKGCAHPPDRTSGGRFRRHLRRCGRAPGLTAR